jgi:hypothetical protein
MFQATKRTLIAVVVVAAMIMPAAACATAYARFTLDRSAPVSAPAVVTSVPQIQGVQAPSNGGFEWGDAGIGAAVTLALVGAGAVVLTPRRRQGRHAAVN